MAAQPHTVPTARWERLLDVDVDLAEALGDDVAARARDRIGVATIDLQPGAWQPHEAIALGQRPFALLVCDGMIVRELAVAGTLTADLIGPGDIVSLDAIEDPLLAAGERWHVGATAKVAILDDRVLPAIHAWPALGARMVARAARQAARAAEQRAISHLPRVELRIRALLWHLAGRWGRIGAPGVVLPVELTHEALGRLVGARRPTVTLALGELARDGAVVRRADGAWVLAHDSNPSPVPLSLGVVGATPALVAVERPPARAALHGDLAALAARVERLRILTARERTAAAAVVARCRDTCARSRDRRLAR